MEQKINIAELLKDCPSGMELNCTMWDNVKFDHIDMSRDYPIYITMEGDTLIQLTEYGQWDHKHNAKCVIFPKGKTTWKGFVPPCKFKDGDILATDLGSVFFLNTRLNTDEYYGCSVGKGGDGSFHICEPFAYKECCGLATEEEKAKLFQAIKDNGYKWNEETKTLEELPKFKVGDKIKKLGNIFTIIQVKDNNYLTKCGNKIPIDNQDDFTLVPNKFDITTLKPFGEVLVRVCDKSKWIGDFYLLYNDAEKDFPYNCVCGCWSQCVPFKGNEYLLDTTNDCDEFYKTW